MELREYWRDLSPADKRKLAERCETTVGHLANVALWGKRCGEKLAVNLERETGRQVVCETLRPDVDWAVLRGASRRPSRATSRNVG